MITRLGTRTRMDPAQMGRHRSIIRLESADEGEVAARLGPDRRPEENSRRQAGVGVGLALSRRSEARGCLEVMPSAVLTLVLRAAGRPLRDGSTRHD